MQSSGSNDNDGQDREPTAAGAAASYSDKMSIIAWQNSLSLQYKKHKRNHTHNQWKIKKSEQIEGNYISNSEGGDKMPNKPMESAIGDMRWKKLMPPYALSKAN